MSGKSKARALGKLFCVVLPNWKASRADVDRLHDATGLQLTQNLRGKGGFKDVLSGNWKTELQNPKLPSLTDPWRQR